MADRNVVLEIARVTVCDKCGKVIIDNDIYYIIENKNICLKCMLKNLDSQKYQESEATEDAGND